MDGGFLFRLYASTRAEEMTHLGWGPLQREIFLTSQFQARQQDYRRRFPGAETAVVLAGGVPAGAWIVDRGPEALRLVDLALLPEYQNKGIGRRLAADLMAEAGRLQKPIRAHALRESRALQFWSKVGFKTVPGGDELYSAIEWRPKPAKT